MTATATDVTTSIAPRRLTRTAGIGPGGRRARRGRAAQPRDRREADPAVDGDRQPAAPVRHAGLGDRHGPARAAHAARPARRRRPRPRRRAHAGADPQPARRPRPARRQRRRRRPPSSSRSPSSGSPALTGYVWFAFARRGGRVRRWSTPSARRPRRRHPGPARARRHRDHRRAHRVHLRGRCCSTRGCCSSCASGRSARWPGATAATRLAASLPFVRRRAAARARCSPGRSTRSRSATTRPARSARNVGRDPRRRRASRSTLLCGAATAAAGPIVFVGLMVPHVVRAITGPDQRWILPTRACSAPVLLLGADVARPGRRPARRAAGRHRHRARRRARVHLRSCAGGGSREL